MRGFVRHAFKDDPGTGRALIAFPVVFLGLSFFGWQAMLGGLIGVGLVTILGYLDYQDFVERMLSTDPNWRDE